MGRGGKGFWDTRRGWETNAKETEATPRETGPFKNVTKVALTGKGR